MANASVANLFSTVVHDALPHSTNVVNLFSTVVHEALPHSTNVVNLFSTVVHEAVPHSTNVTNLFGTVTHDGPPFLVSDITGTTGITASFDASVQGYGTSSTHYRWSWQSVPTGSSITNAILPLPDSGSTYPMSGNSGLWHFDSQDISITSQGSVGLVDSFGDGWHGSNWVTVLVNSIVVIDSATLGAGGGPEWYNYDASDGDIVEVVYTSLGAGSPHWGSECSYILNSGSDGGGVSFYTSPLFPTASYSFTASGFLTSSTITTPDTSDYFVAPLDALVQGATLTASSYVGENAYYFDGVDDSILLPPSSFMNIDGGNSRTIAFWASASTWVNNDVFFSYGQTALRQDFTLLQKNGPNLRLNLWGDDFEVSVPTITGWNHYFIIYDSSDTTSYVYQNNQLLGSHVQGGPLATYPSNSVVIGDGASPTWAGGYFNGVIDEFAVWDRALNSCERGVVYGFLQTSSIDAAVGSSPNLLQQFSFVPDVTGTYYMDLQITDNNNCSYIFGTISASITSGPGPTPPATASCIERPSAEGDLFFGRGFVINNYRNLSKGRDRRIDQVPFKLGSKDRLGLRLDNTIATPSGSVPTYCTGS